MRLPNDLIPGRAVLLDRELIRRVYAIRALHGNDPRDEVWDGVLVLLPLVDNEHQMIRGQIGAALLENGDFEARLGSNVSDRRDGWMTNYRTPDVVAFAPDTAAVNCDTHWCGGPDFVVEVASPGEEPREKLGFYAAVGTRELLVIDRDPWAVELYRLSAGRLESVGRTTPTDPRPVASEVVPLAFRLDATHTRPRLVVTAPATGREWWH